ncbi:MAG TPA: hypothetical protein VNK95_22325 [Caldilineaceae bacterium]|nr:hypothetical protein [Caldilineaceae bacterium]
MSLERIPKWAWAVLAAVAALSLGSAIYHSGWSQGFTLGLLTGNVDGAQLAPYLAYRAGPGWHPGGYGGFGFFGVLFRLVFFLFLLALLAKLFGFMRWRMQGGAWGGPHGPYGPWAHHYGPHPQGGQPYGAQPGPQPGQAPAEQPGSPTQPDEPKPAVWTHV